jgi:hypothetical protein
MQGPAAASRWGARSNKLAELLQQEPVAAVPLPARQQQHSKPKQEKRLAKEEVVVLSSSSTSSDSSLSSSSDEEEEGGGHTSTRIEGSAGGLLVGARLPDEPHQQG